MTGITRKPAFWIAYAVLAALSLVLAWQLFPKAIPLVHLDIRMARNDAVTRAQAVAAERGLVRTDARAAASFRNDQSAQTYIELEGGGKSAFARLVEGTAYSPYWWEVRLFTPGEVEEATLRFRPDGALDGFTRRVPETYVHAANTRALDPATALELARKTAGSDWGVDFGAYSLLEQSQETRPSGRIDHTFVFERPDAFGDARIRLQLNVAGDELIGILPFLHVPEKFERRFEELRSANDLIANIASLTAGALYGLGGCILAVLWLLRRRWLLWRPALVAGSVVGGLMALMVLASAPAAWSEFDTAQTVESFWIQHVGLALLALFGGTLLYGLVFMAAESLTRRAFPHQPQLWRLWTREAGATKQVLGRTLGGYLFVPLELALISAFYYATNQWLGWWQPSESLTDPNILSSFVPALSPIAISLQAGFMEECLFRAIPLALGALLGARYGRRRLGIVLAVVLQAVVFAGAHANYPGFPAYSRLVELLLPATLWALIFLRFGLLSTILLHALFDLSLFAIPLFLIDAPGAWIQRALVMAAAAVPLAIVLWRRRQVGGWGELPAALWNGAWQPDATPAQPPVASADAQAQAKSTGARGAWLQRMLPLLAAVGALAWLWCTPFHADVPALTIDRAGAEAAATAALEQRGIRLGRQWQRSSGIRLAPDDSRQALLHSFVWREAGAVAYRALSGHTLAPPMWEVRFARFDGDVADRAEEWRVTVVGRGVVRQVQHRLPEGAPGVSLDRDAALAIAQKALRERFDLDPGALQLRVAEQTKRDARSDWSFAFADPKVDVGADGEARVQIVVAGDEVVAAGRTVFVPESWQRTETERDNRLQIARLAAGFAMTLVALLALMQAVIAWNAGRYDKRALLCVSALVVALAVVALANNWPALALQLHTSEPVLSQLATTLLGALFGSLLMALMLGLLSGIGIYYARTQTMASPAGRLPAWAAGIAAALASAGLAAIFAQMAPRTMPLWPDLKLAALASPILGAVLEPLELVGGVGVVLFALYLLDRITAGWTRRAWIPVVLFVALACAPALAAGNTTPAAWIHGAIEGLASVLLVRYVLRYDLRSIPAFLATATLLNAAGSAALWDTRNAWLLFAASAAMTVTVTVVLTRYIARTSTLPSSTVA
jgi:Type II CAAX prenyl endopeptidase Rce1-like